MVRRGWSQFDVPTGWVQIVRGPLLCRRWPSSRRPSRLGDTEGPVHEALQAELKRARSVVQMQPAWRSHQLRGQDVWRRRLVALIQEAKVQCEGWLVLVHSQPMEPMLEGGVEMTRPIIEGCEEVHEESASQSDIVRLSEASEVGDDVLDRGRSPSEAFASMSSVDLKECFTFRVCLMRMVSHIMKGAFRLAIRTALEEILVGHRMTRLLPRMMFSTHVGGESAVF